MELSGDLLRTFAEITNDSSQNESKEQYAYGTVTSTTDGVVYVQLDGSSLTTPVGTMSEVSINDRVMVMLKNHRATIVGNITHPALTQVGAVYTKMTDDGLVVGQLDSNGNPTGTYILITPTAYQIKDSSNNVLASFATSSITFGSMATFAASYISLAGGAGYFSPSLVKLGSTASAEIQLCNNAGRIKQDGDQMLLQGGTATGLRSRRADGYRTEVIARAGYDQFAMAFQSFTSNNNVYVSHVLDSNGARYRLRPGTRVSVSQDGSNYYNLLQSNDQLFYFGTIKVSKKVGASAYYEFSRTATVPTGFVLAGIIQCSTSKNRMRLIEFKCAPSNNTVGATYYNSGSAIKSTFTLKWFAIRSTSYGTAADDSVDFDPND